MKDYQFPEGCLFLNKNRIINCFEIEVGMEILGFNRNRKLCWGKVDEANRLTDASCCHLWTNRGDSPFSKKNALISPSGPKAVNSIKKEFCAGEIIQIEMPGLKDITKFIRKENNLTADILIEVLKLNVLPIHRDRKPIIRVPSGNLTNIHQMLTFAGVKYKSRAGELWSWIVPESHGQEEHKKVTSALLSKKTLMIANLLTDFDDGKYNLSLPDQNILRFMIILYYFSKNKPFKMSTHPVSYPQAVSISEDSFQPYAKVIGISDFHSKMYVIKFRQDQFTPLVSNFMITS